MWFKWKRIKKGDYYYAKVPNHPNATKDGYVLEHRIVAENTLGRLLTSDEVVHHIDGNKHNNSPDNLEVMLSRDHTQFHSNQQGKAYVDLKCPWCNKQFTLALNKSHLQNKSRYTTCSRSCSGKLSRYIQLNGINSNIEQKLSDNVIRIYHT